MTVPSPISEEPKLETQARYRTDWVDGTTEHRVLDYLNLYLPPEYVPFHIEKFERHGKTVIWSRRAPVLRSGSLAQEGWRGTAMQIVREEWHRAVKEFSLKPGTPTEAVTARILNRLISVAPTPQSDGRKK